MRFLERSIIASVTGALWVLTAACGMAAELCNVRDFGAAGDGRTDDTAAIRRAIATADAAGGGTVYFPAGDYLSYSLRLCNRLTLHIGSGATIIAAEPSADLSVGYDAPESNEAAKYYQDFGHTYWHNSLIWGEDLTDVAIIGPGRIFGRGLSRGGAGKRRDLLPEERKLAQRPDLSLPTAETARIAAIKRGPFGYPREDTLPTGVGNKAIALKNCRNVTFRDFTISHGGHFAILATGVDNWTCDNLKIDTNRDGIDIDCCQNVRMTNCTVNAPTDDAICLKSSFALGELRMTENITITNCQVSGYDEGTLLDGTRTRLERRKDYAVGRIKLGTESNGGFRNITISNCVFDYSRGLALESVDGALMEDIAISNLTMRNVLNAPIYIRLGSRMRGPSGLKIGTARRIRISNIVAHNVSGESGIQIAGIPGHQIEDVWIENAFFGYAGGGTKEQGERAIPESETGYPEANRWGVMPASGLWARHARNIHVERVEMRFEKPDGRPAVMLEDVQGAEFSSVRLSGAERGSLIVKPDVKDLTIESSPDLRQASYSAWRPDLGDGTYKNPVLNADYSDPDVIRVGDDYWMTSSSFGHVPGLPILHSRDLVNWTLVNHALPQLVPVEHFATPHHGEGVWAPAIRHHAGKFYIYYPDPDFGIYVITATDPRGAWSIPTLVKAGRGLIDPCPLWDDDGQVYLVHAWAQSRSGKSNIITLHRLSADGLSLVDEKPEGRVVIDGNKMPGWDFIEGPKIYKRNGWYYIFAPAGGVATGYQAVFRARKIEGPYENRITLEQGTTPVNGPHQGAWVDTPAGEHWFLHFQEIPALGRVVHLQPMSWGKDDWPRMGTAVETGNITGNPVLRHAKPRASATSALASMAATEPATSDDFSSPALGLQWQWQANPSDKWARIDTATKTLHLACQPKPDEQSHWFSPNLLLQKFPASSFAATVKMQFSPDADGATAGLMVFGYSYAWLGLRRENGALQLVLVTCPDANKGGREQIVAQKDATSSSVYLRVTVGPKAECRFSYSDDGKNFTSIGDMFQATSSRWVGGKVGLFASSRPGATTEDSVAFREFTVTAAQQK